jgi:hypothetical protein
MMYRWVLFLGAALPIEWPFPRPLLVLTVAGAQPSQEPSRQHGAVSENYRKLCTSYRREVVRKQPSSFFYDVSTQLWRNLKLFFYSLR